MKKILTLPTVTLFLVAILFAGGCKPESPSTRGPKKITIKLKAVEINGEMHLKMSDSNGKKGVIDTLETLVIPGDSVIWKLKLFSGIEKIDTISPKTAGKIMNKKAENIPGTKRFGLKIPDNAPMPSQREKYNIVFKDRDGHQWPIDPYLRIPKEVD